MADMKKLEEVKAALIASDEAVGGTRHLGYWDDMARAAVEALRELSPEIADHLSWHFNNDISAGDQYQVSSLWNDALSALLKEEGE